MDGDGVDGVDGVVHRSQATQSIFVPQHRHLFRFCF
jgi:hypothetical protein